MSAFRNDLEYPNLLTCQMRLVGSGATSRPPVQLPRKIADAVASQPFGNGGASLDDLALERAVLKRKEEREKDHNLRSATSREALERATVAKMKAVTGADDSICIAILRDHAYDVEESIEAYLEKM